MIGGKKEGGGRIRGRKGTGEMGRVRKCGGRSDGGGEGESRMGVRRVGKSGWWEW